LASVPDFGCFNDSITRRALENEHAERRTGTNIGRENECAVTAKIPQKRSARDESATSAPWPPLESPQGGCLGEFPYLSIVHWLRFDLSRLKQTHQRISYHSVQLGVNFAGVSEIPPEVVSRIGAVRDSWEKHRPELLGVRIL